MIVFELTMPHVGSWNGKWTGADRSYIRIKRECDVPKSVWNKDFYHYWDDGWAVRISVTKVPANDARKLERKSDGFCGYDWMIRSIIKRGKIEYDES